MKSLIAILASVVLVGCAGQGPVMPAPYTVVITADDKLNPDRNGKPTPVQVKIYRMKPRPRWFLRPDWHALCGGASGPPACGVRV